MLLYVVSLSFSLFHLSSFRFCLCFSLPEKLLVVVNKEKYYLLILRLLPALQNCLDFNRLYMIKVYNFRLVYADCISTWSLLLLEFIQFLVSCVSGKYMYFNVFWALQHCLHSLWHPSSQLPWFL